MRPADRYALDAARLLADAWRCPVCALPKHPTLGEPAVCVCPNDERPSPIAGHTVSEAWHCMKGGDCVICSPDTPPAAHAGLTYADVLGTEDDDVIDNEPDDLPFPNVPAGPSGDEDDGPMSPLEDAA
jgi:hypothetical protein